jgi:hypothetical protein
LYRAARTLPLPAIKFSAIVGADTFPPHAAMLFFVMPMGRAKCEPGPKRAHLCDRRQAESNFT